ncbi:redox-regulated ATPase YchF [Kiritimatiella glycovorans]|uniref:Ribosome-binding ATPase YchF n=1 Tax=Kiritimatiella glycovorans TaxID=1307763 RepID=A0A0G3EHR6_9BACT|nr:redox-regulated ATPase YchF [Kiritimatiella glycovorans]AKJ64340.1 Ribosome-binding ATPase YchF [Kiritimatiella glycovorans]
MSVHIGIVGLPNVGKSTVFNALSTEARAETANYPFCTIESNRAAVPVRDPRLEAIAEIARPAKVVPTAVEFADIAGLVEGASRGEGLGNRFLAEVRLADALLHVIRCFHDDNIAHVGGGMDPCRDADVIETELMLADIETLERRREKVEKWVRGDRTWQAQIEVIDRLLARLGEGRPATTAEEPPGGPLADLLRAVPLLTAKPILYCANTDTSGRHESQTAVDRLRERTGQRGVDLVEICAREEEDLREFDAEEAEGMREELGLGERGLDRLVHAAYHTLGLITFFTAGPKEVRAWTVRRGAKAPEAAGKIHTDFERGFIRARVIAYDDFIGHGGEKGCRDKGLMREEGKDYVVRDGDVIEFLAGT